MIQFHVYPGGKKRIVTYSYDDGHKNDERLIALFNKYKVKGTFHLNGKNYENDRILKSSAVYMRGTRLPATP